MINKQNKRKEIALVKGAEKYKWGIYNGSKLTITSRMGRTMVMQKGTKFGVRPSASGKDVRLVFEELGLSIVFTMDMHSLNKIYRNSTPVTDSTVKPGKNGPGEQKMTVIEFIAAIKFPRAYSVIQEDETDNSVVIEDNYSGYALVVHNLEGKYSVYTDNVRDLSPADVISTYLSSDLEIVDGDSIKRVSEKVATIKEKIDKACRDAKSYYDRSDMGLRKMMEIIDIERKKAGYVK